MNSLGKIFRSEQGVIPGLKPQNYDDNLRKQKFLLQFFNSHAHATALTNFEGKCARKTA
jgi:hypothetical protein